MIALDRGFFQVKAGGRAYEIARLARTPFAVVTSFEQNLSWTLATPTDFEGFRTYLDRLVGYHFHFITDDREAGGHVLGFRLTSGKLSVDQ